MLKLLFCFSDVYNLDFVIIRMTTALINILVHVHESKYYENRQNHLETNRVPKLVYSIPSSYKCFSTV